MTQIKFDIQSRAVLDALGNTTARLQDLRPAMKQVGEYMVGRTDDRFKSEIAPDGTPWAPLSAAYLRWKQRTGKIPKILQLRGRLRKSIVYRATVDGVEIGTNVVYAAIHQFGGTLTQAARSRMVNFKVSKNGQSRFAKKGKANFQQAVTYGDGTRKISARPFLGVNLQDEQEITQIVIGHLSQGR